MSRLLPLLSSSVHSADTEGKTAYDRNNDLETDEEQVRKIKEQSPIPVPPMEEGGYKHPCDILGIPRPRA